MPGETINPGGVFGNNMISQPQISPLGWYNQTDTTAQNPVGGKVRWGNIMLRYVQIDPTGVIPVPGAPLYATAFTPQGSTTTTPVITLAADYDATNATTGLQVIGVMGPFTIVLPTVKFYTWVQVGGVALVTSAGVTATSNVLIGSSTDNQFAVISDGSSITNIPAARVMGASQTNSLCPALLMNMDW